MNRSSYESMKEGAAEAEAKKAAGQELDEEDKMYLEYFSHMTEPVDVTYAEHLKQHARPGLFELFGTDEQSYMDYYDPVSYTHLDVYKRQSLGSECRTATNCLYDADFLKIRNITIGYDLPEYLTEKVGISKISLRFQINDPKALWIKNNAGIDPETLGIRKQASYMFGVNLSL